MRVESQLILRARAGERRALEELIGAYQAPVAGFIAARVTDRAATADVCQTAFVKMVLALPKLRTPDTFEPWLYRIAENACRDFRRRERGWKRLFVPLGPAHEIARDNAPPDEADARHSELQVELDRIDPAQRELLALSLEKPRSYGELAELTRLSIPAVKSRLFRARAALRALVARKETKHEH